MKSLSRNFGGIYFYGTRAKEVDAMTSLFPPTDHLDSANEEANNTSQVQVYTN